MSPVRVGFTAVGRAVEWFRSRVEGVDGRPPVDVTPDGSPMWEVFRAGLTVEECPWLTSEQIATIYAQIDPDERPQRLLGAWEGPTSDRIFTGMAAARVLPELPEGRWSVMVSADHGEVAGREWVVVLLFNGPKVIIAAEYVNATATTPEQDARGIAAALARLGCPIPRVDRWIGDVNTSGKRGAGARVNDDLAAALSNLCGAPGLVRFEKPNKSSGSVEYGTRLVNYALHRGDLSVLDDCRRTAGALWHHREDGDDHTHAVDAIRYGVVALLSRRAEYAAIDWRVA
jgi:hypothetical protein